MLLHLTDSLHVAYQHASAGTSQGTTSRCLTLSQQLASPLGMQHWHLSAPHVAQRLLVRKDLAHLAGPVEAHKASSWPKLLALPVDMSNGSWYRKTEVPSRLSRRRQAASKPLASEPRPKLRWHCYAWPAKLHSKHLKRSGQTPQSIPCLDAYTSRKRVLHDSLNDSSLGLF